MSINITKKETNLVKDFFTEYLIYNQAQQIESQSVYFSRKPLQEMHDLYVEYCSEQDMQRNNILCIEAFTVVVVSFHRVSLKLHNNIFYLQYYAYALYNYFNDSEYYYKQKLQYFKQYRQHNAEHVNGRRKVRQAERKTEARILRETNKIEFD